MTLHIMSHLQSVAGLNRILVRLLSLMLLVAVLPGLNALSSFVTTAQISPEANQLPLSFIPNVGQNHPSVQYQAHDMGGTVFFTANEVVLALPNNGSDTSHITAQLRFEGASPAPTITPVQRLPGVVNYFVGNQTEQWHTGVSTFAGIVYEDLYPGIDLRYDGVNHALKGTFTVAPHVNPATIRWRHISATNVQVDQATGNLLVTLPGKNSPVLTETAPVAWQDIAGQRIPVAVSYAVAADGMVSFNLGSYNNAYPLIIDPTIEYSTYLGGSGLDEIAGIAIDASGNSYVTGTTVSTDIAASPINGFAGGVDIFVAKINPSGTQLVYLTYIGGSRDDEDEDEEDEEATDIAVDSQGNAYITGTTDAIDFPTRNAVQSQKSGSLYIDDAFVVKLNANGTVNYSTYLGGAANDEGEGIAVDSAGNAYITGSTDSTDFPTRNALYASRAGGFDAFVVKLSAAGTSLEYGTYLGGSGTDFGGKIAVDSSNAIYVVGDTFSANFPTQGAVQGTKSGSSGTSDGFVAKLNSSGTSLVYSTFLGGSQNEALYGIAVDGSGNSYITGNTRSNDFPTTNAFQFGYAGGSCSAPSSGPCGDAFVTKLNATGSQRVYSTYFGGSGDDFGYDIAVNSAGEAYVTGSTSSSNFPTTNSIQEYAGNTDAFVAQFNAAGSSLIYSTFLGSNQFDAGSAIAVDNAGQAYVAGETASNTFPTTGSAWKTSYAGNGDGFVVKLSHGGSVEPEPDPNPSTTPTPDPSTTPTPDPSTTPTPDPAPDNPPASMLWGSYIAPSRFLLKPDQTLTYRIVLYNNGTSDATIAVTNELPDELSYVADSISDDGTYTADTRMLSWQDVRVPAGSTTTLNYDVEMAVQVDFPEALLNTATISVGDTQFTRSTVIVLLPGNYSGGDDNDDDNDNDDDWVDYAQPLVQSLRIGTQDVLTAPATQLTIEASNDTNISSMYIREWYLDTAGIIPQWQVVQSSGWVPYTETYDWTLGDQSGTHYVGVWVKDGQDKIAQLDLNAIDSVSLIQPDTTVESNRAVLYAVSYTASESVTIDLQAQTGDVDLYVWYPGNFLLPNHASVNDGTNQDSASFTTPRDGLYVIMVYGFEASTFNLSITPAGDARNLIASLAGTATESASSVTQSMAASDDWQAPHLESLLAQTGLNPLGSDTAISPEDISVTLYLPFVIR